MRMTNLVDYDGLGNVLATYVYAYDLADRLTSETIDGLTRYYLYDNTNQIISDNGTGLSYDLNGNRTDGSYQTGPDDQLKTDGVWNYYYDGEGNLHMKVGISNGLTWTYQYDERNMMTSAVEIETTGGALIQDVSFAYDVFGNRISLTVAVGSSMTTQQFAWDGSNIWADLDGNGALATRRIYGDGTDQALARISSTGVAAWYLADRLGSVRDIGDDVTGAVIDHVTYDAFGLITSESDPSSGDRYKAFGYQYNREPTHIMWAPERMIRQHTSLLARIRWDLPLAIPIYTGMWATALRTQKTRAEWTELNLAPKRDLVANEVSHG
jgi:hypothetical protein